MLKCLFIGLEAYRSPGGMQRFNQRLLRVLDELGEGLDSDAILLWDRPSDLAGNLPRVRHHACSRSKTWATRVFLKLLMTRRPERILYGHVLLTPLAVVARCLLGHQSKQLLMAHGYEVWMRPFRSRVPLWQKLIVNRYVDRVLTVSGFTALQMRAGYGIPTERFLWLPNAVDLPAGAAIRRLRRSESRRILTVSRLRMADYLKGVPQLLQALALVRERFPAVQLDIVGDGPLRPSLMELARQLGMERNAHFYGHVSDRELESLYRRAEIFALPSQKEGFGIVYLEAWAHGLPVIAGNRDAGREVVTHGVNGLCVDPESAAEIAEAISLLLADTEWANQLGAAGLETVRRFYTHNVFRENLRRILWGLEGTNPLTCPDSPAPRPLLMTTEPIGQSYIGSIREASVP